MNNIKIEIGNRIREIRKKGGLSIRQLAEELGISYLTMQKIETDKTSPSVTLLCQIADCLNYPIASFLEKKELPVIHIKKDDQHVLGTKNLELRLIASKGLISENMSAFVGKARKGRFISRHRNEGFEFAYIIKGKCMFKHGRERYKLNEGDLLFFDAREWHSVTALEPLEFLGLHFLSK